MMTQFDSLVRSNNEADAEKALSRGVRAVLDQELRSELDAEIKAHLRNAAGAPIKRMIPMSWIAAAASLVIIFMATFWWLNQQTSVTPAQYAMADIITHPGINKGDAGSAANRTLAIKAFNAQNWQEAISYWSSTDLTAEESRYYLALSHFYAGNYAEANTQFASLHGTPSIYAQEVSWFYGLSLILNGEEAKGKQVLSTIAQDQWHYEEASSLISAH